MDFKIDYNRHLYKVTAIPQQGNNQQSLLRFKITLDGNSMGFISCNANQWKNDNIIDQRLIDLIGAYIEQLMMLQE